MNMKYPKCVKISITNFKTVKKIDKLVNYCGFKNRSKCIQFLVDIYIQDLKVENGKSLLKS